MLNHDISVILQTEDRLLHRGWSIYFFISNLKSNNRIWTYFVDWNKVFDNARQIEIELNCLNYLIDKVDLDNEFRYLLRTQPQVAKAIPALVVRDGNISKQFNMLVDYSNKKNL